MDQDRRIAFYAPLKAPDHPVPSGDRLMARQLIAALEMAGHRVEVVSPLRAYLRDPEDAAGQTAILAKAEAERQRIAADWARQGSPGLWFCYHSYYKAPDWLGPALCAGAGVPYVTVEASWSERRNIGLWAGQQQAMRAGVAGAALNICLTARDERGLAEALPEARLARLPPFVDMQAMPPAPEPGHLVTVAMMRHGDKLESYRALAAALRRVPGAWRLSVAGDGEAAGEVRALFADLPVNWLGRMEPPAVAQLLARGAAYVWPGCGEAYGLAYLEAQAAGLPIVAFRTAGVPEVVADGETGFLVSEGDTAGFAEAVGRLLRDDGLRGRMAAAAVARVSRDHTLAAASLRLDGLIRPLIGGQ